MNKEEGVVVEAVSDVDTAEAQAGANMVKRIELAVLAHYSMKDPIQRKAVEVWQESRQEAFQEQVVGKVIHTFQSEELFNRAVAYCLTDIDENIALLKVKLAKERREEAGAHFKAGIGEHGHNGSCRSQVFGLYATSHRAQKCS